MTLRPCEDADDATIGSWAAGEHERALWTSSPAPVTAETVRAWRAAPGVLAYVFRECAYGEIWQDPEEHEAELAHLIVAPAHRRRGVAQAMIGALVAEAQSRGFADIWLRVAAENAPAIACYRRAGFVRAAPSQEARFNERQPRAYVWMRWEPTSSGPGAPAPSP